nr:PREDICTED: trypsin-1-like [Megachile rotundata]
MMCIRSIICVAVVIATTCFVNCEELQSGIEKGVSLNNTESNVEKSTQDGTNSTTETEDKNFWDWLNGVLSGLRPTTSAPPIAEAPESCPPCRCGITNTQRRIVGGVETQVNQYPWMALMMFKGRFYCGASVINSRYVLTAAHCVDRFDPNLMSIRILEHDRNSTTESETQMFKVEKVIRHSAYSTYNYNNDIALVKVKDSIKFEGKMRPVCLPEREKTFGGMEGIVTGWGALDEGGPISPTLQEVTVPILTNAECRETKYPSRKITDNMICAGYKDGMKDSCQGDSGGPLHVVTNNTHSVVGVVSWGEGCAKPGYPGVYSRVNRYLTWIEQNTEGACYC